MKKITVIGLMLLFALPALAKIDGGVSQTYFYDLENTIMEKIVSPTKVDDSLFTSSFFYPNSYKPLNMLSNDILFKNVQNKARFFNKRTVPSIYNISFKSAKITMH